jgi:hypothetical protein
VVDGQRVAGLRFADPRVQGLLHALLIFRLVVTGFTARDLRPPGAPAGAGPRRPHRRSDHLRPAPAAPPRADRGLSPAPTATGSPTPGCATRCSSPAPTRGCCAPGSPSYTPQPGPVIPAPRRLPRLRSRRRPIHRTVRPGGLTVLEDSTRRRQT